MIKFILTLGAGVYAGVYIAQNYDIDKVEHPAKLVEKASNYIKSKLSGDEHDGKKK